MKSGQRDAFQSGAYELTCEEVSNTKLPPAILVPQGSKELWAARQKRGSSQRVLETVSAHSDRRTCSPQPRALGELQAEEQCRGVQSKKGLESKSQLERWRLGGPLPGQSLLTKHSGMGETPSHDEPATILSQEIEEEEQGRGGRTELKGWLWESEGRTMDPALSVRERGHSWCHFWFVGQVAVYLTCLFLVPKNLNIAVFGG